MLLSTHAVSNLPYCGVYVLGLKVTSPVQFSHHLIKFHGPSLYLRIAFKMKQRIGKYFICFDISDCSKDAPFPRCYDGLNCNVFLHITALFSFLKVLSSFTLINKNINFLTPC